MQVMLKDSNLQIHKCKINGKNGTKLCSFGQVEWTDIAYMWSSYPLIDSSDAVVVKNQKYYYLIFFFILG